MLKNGRLWVAFLFILFSILAFTPSADSNDQVVFEKDFTIGQWHLHVSQHTFSVAVSGEGILKISKTTPQDEIKRGFLVLNGHFTFLRDFLTGDALAFEKEVTLKTTNRLFVFLLGQPGAAVSIQIIKSDDTTPAPKITFFSAEPTTIKKGGTSTLSWQTENTEFGEINPGNIPVAAGGTLQVSPDQDTTYTLTAFGVGMPATAEVTVFIENSPPLADSQVIDTDEDQPLGVTLTGSDMDGDLLSFEVLSPPDNGNLAGTPPNLTYTPIENYNGPDAFRFTASDGKTDSEPATVAITVRPVNDAPVSNSQTVDLNEDETKPITLGASDVEEDAPLTYIIVAEPENGTLSGDAPNLSYTPRENYNGSDSFSFKVNDGQADSNTATISLTINPINDPPLANAGGDRIVVTADTVQLDGGASSDLDGDTLTYRWSFDAVPAGSTAAFSNGSIVNPTFVPDLVGDYVVQLIVNDGKVDSAPDKVTINVEPRKTTVPDVTGKTRAAAEAALQAANLLVDSITEENSDDVPEGLVIRQNPIGGLQVIEFTAVDFTISLGPENQPPAVIFNASPSSISQGESSNLSWSWERGVSAHIDNGIGSVLNDGVIQVFPENTTTYTLTVTGPGGTTSAQVTIEVLGNPEPQPEGSFGETYEDLIPPDSTVERYDPERFALITGDVRDMAGSPIIDASITIHGYPEYGTVYTDSEGQFTIPVEGGGTLTVAYQKEGLIPSQRKVDVPWNDTAVVETVVLIAEDPVATTLTFDGNADTVVTHKSEDVVDESGTRAVTMVFSGDNTAYLVDEQGNDVQELTTITTRATEYQIPQAMPAKLPPNSAFTYCAELSVDGAQRVRFDKPVTTFIDNFLGFPVGSIVPVGYYDRDKGIWVPSENGVVVELLDTDADGKVDGLDADGDGAPDDLDGDDSFSSEIRGLDDSQRYAPGATFWRVQMNHFTPFDCNWPFGPPADAIASNAKGTTVVDQQEIGFAGTTAGQSRGDIQCVASFVEQRSRVFHEDIPIPGTDMTLHYTSNRVAGYKPGVISVPASGETVPESLVKIVIEAYVAGKKYEIELPPEPNQIAEIEWDGLDYLGRPVQDSVIAHVRIGFVYYGVYFEPSIEGRAFGQAGTGALTVPTRQEVTIWNDRKVPIIIGKGSLAEGWTLSAHHQMSPLSQNILLKGDGTITSNNASIIETYAGDGSGSQFFQGMGGPATSAKIPNPSSLAMDMEGNLYIFSSHLPGYQNWRSYILKVDAQGIVTTFASAHGFWGHNGYMAADTQGNIYHTAYYNWYGGANGGCVKRVTPEEESTTVVGACGSDDYSYSGIYFKGMHIDNQGNIYTAVSTHKVLKMDTAGVLTVVAGNGTPGSEGDGGPAVQAQVNSPRDVYVDGEGYLYIAETNRVRKVDPSGIITTVAGGGSWGTVGDGGPATEAYLNWVEEITMDSAGNLYIVESWNHSIRKVDSHGVITTVAGLNNTSGGYSGDGVIGSQAQLNKPTDVLVDPSGNIFITDMYNGRVRKVGSPSAGIKAASAESAFFFTEENGLGHIMSTDGRHMKTIDLNTGVSLNEFGYDEENNLVAIADPFGNTIRIERDALTDVPTAIISPDGIRTELIIDANNHLKRVTHADGSFYDFVYTFDGLMLVETEPAGNSFEHIFDDKGRLNDVLDEEDGHWTYTRSVDVNSEILTEVLSAEGNLTSFLDHTDSTGKYTSTITDPSGAVTHFEQSDDGLTENHSLPCGTDLEYIYDVDPEYKFKYIAESSESTPSGLEKVILRDKTYEDTDSDDTVDLITETLTVNGKATTIAIDTLLAKRTVTSPESRTVVALYDPDTLLTESVSIPGRYDTTFGYDSRGRMTSILTNTRQTVFAYNPEGFLGSVTDPENQTTTYTYDPVGRITGINRPDGGLVGFTYDNNGNMTVLTNPVDVSHGFGFNKVNRNSTYSTPLSGSYSYIYDKDRWLIQTNFPSGKQIFNIYDKTRLSQIQTPEGNIDFTYLCGTKIDSITKGAESITYGYDGKLATSEALSGTLNKALIYTYNNDFDVSSFSYAGQTENYSYDSDGLLTDAGNFTITRNAENGLPEAVSGGTLNLGRTFNGYGEMAGQGYSVNSKNVITWALARDNNGRIVSKSETVGVDETTNFDYTYDSMGRLGSVKKDGNIVENYSYDLSGTRISETNTLRGFNGRTFSYSDEDHLLTADSVTYAYDVDGFLTSKTDGTDITTYSYSSRGELLNVTLPEGTEVEYLHDPLERRIAKKINGSLVEKYLWQGLTRLLAVYDGSDALLMRFEYAGGRMPVAMTSGGSTYYLTYDQVGSLRLVADSTGAVIKRIDYDSFGNIIDDTNPLFEVPFGFAGGLYDPDTELIRFGYRDYDPDVGRWTAKDPIGFAGGDTDLYGYVLNDPINKVDPYGLFGLAGAASGAIGGAIGGAVVGAVTGGISGMTSGAISGAVIGGVVGSVTGPIAGITVGTIGSAFVTGILGELVGATSVENPAEQQLMESGEYYENERLLMEYEEMLNDPIWEKLNACSD